ncbi:P-loop containing nucleoside triphosphate hydrolase protein [Trametes maxima]|nr:P-loop containing nucleoside triphosphate hydrolase protein [Trametes maxima]
MDDELWASFDDGPAFVPDPLPPPAPAPPSPPASQPRSNVPIMTAPARPPTANGPVPDPPDLKAKPYYDQVKHTLTTVFGLQSFRALQLKAICDAMDGRDVFVLFPTGSGKSLTFQLPAVCQDGMTVVVSPLKSLIMDQQRALSKRDVDVEYVLGNGEMSESKRQAIRQRLRTGQPPKLLYLTPEMLHMSDWMKDILKDLHAKRRLMRFVVDEAHLITDWGRTFRDSYIVLSELRKVYPSVPISALTATANAEVEGDIIAKLGLSIHAPLKLSFNRPNLDYDVRHKKKNAVAEIAQYIKQEHPGETGIIYCNARNRCEEVAKALRDDHGLNARHYHASMSEGDRNRVQDMWSKDEVRIIVATIAFGMGIDKPDVRYVIHFNPPGSLKGYYQETGRAGRDGKLAHCILYYATQEFYQRIDWIRKDGQKNGQSPESCRWQEDDFRHVLGYCMNNVRCRRQQVLSFFGEQFAPADCHQMCNNCRDPTPSVTADHTRDAQQAVRLCQSVPRQLTRNQLANALKGSKSQDMVRKGLVGGPFFGACGRMPMGDIERLVDELLHGGFLTTEIVTQGNGYSQPYLLATPRANALLSGKEKLEITFRRGTRGDAAKPPSRARKPRKGGAQDAAAADYDSPSAGPSRTSSSTAPSSRGRRAFVPLPPPEAERSLFQDDPDDENEDEDAVAWAEDEIEEESSPPPAPRRMGTRNVPSASQSVTAGCDSEIEEVDPPPLRVTIIGKEDLRFDGDDGDPETQCNQALTRLRDGISRNDPEIRDLLTEEIIGLLSTTLPNDTEALRNLLECEGISLGLLEPYTKRVLSICTKYCMMRRR